MYHRSKGETAALRCVVPSCLSFGKKKEERKRKESKLAVVVVQHTIKLRERPKAHHNQAGVERQPVAQLRERGYGNIVEEIYIWMTAQPSSTTHNVFKSAVHRLNVGGGRREEKGYLYLLLRYSRSPARNCLAKRGFFLHSCQQRGGPSRIAGTCDTVLSGKAND
jgi:hypothetical protein